MRFKRIFSTDGTRNVVGRVKARHRTNEKAQKAERRTGKGERKQAAREMTAALAAE